MNSMGDVDADTSLAASGPDPCTDTVDEHEETWRNGLVVDLHFDPDPDPDPESSVSQTR